MDQKGAIVKQPIETLPDEMLMEIFKAMDGKTLKESTLVHSKWEFVDFLLFFQFWQLQLFFRT